MRIGDEPLEPEQVAVAARDAALRIELTSAARERMAANRAAADAVAARRPVYGRTTGVGANRHVPVAAGDLDHASRLLRSHAGGLGEPLPEEVVRGTIVVRVNQMAAAGGGQRPEVAEALAALAADPPEIRDLGGLGTGDLTVLAQLAVRGGLSPSQLGDGDALPFMSSNAATIAVATLAWADLEYLLEAGLRVAAISFAGLRGNREAYAEEVAAGRPLPGLLAVAERLRALTEGAPEPARIQDPFGLRTLPQVGGALHDALGALRAVLAVEVNAAAENPLMTADDVLHHGGFHAAGLALALDTARLALVPFGRLALARLSHLLEPELTGLAPFLAHGAAGSSGLMIAEYVGGDALARLRAEAVPAVTGEIVISRGLEEHASFAWQGALQARRAAVHLRTLLALERVAAERALALAAGEEAPADEEIAAAVDRAAAAL